MKYEPNRKMPLLAINSRGAERALARRGAQMAPRLAAGTPTDTGATASSTRVETGHRSASGDRPAVHLVQDAPAVPQTFRQTRDYMIRALGGGA